MVGFLAASLPCVDILGLADQLLVVMDLTLPLHLWLL